MRVSIFYFIFIKRCQYQGVANHHGILSSVSGHMMKRRDQVLLVSRTNLFYSLKRARKLLNTNFGKFLWPLKWFYSVFSRVYDENAEQKDIFDENVAHLVESAIRGTNISVFAYGPTGTGKTFTMLGTATLPGVIPRYAYYY